MKTVEELTAELGLAMISHSQAVNEQRVARLKLDEATDKKDSMYKQMVAVEGNLRDAIERRAGISR